MVLVDKIGRRGLLMKLGPIMVVGMTWCLVAFYCESRNGRIAANICDANIDKDSNRHVQADRRIPQRGLSIFSNISWSRNRWYCHLRRWVWLDLCPSLLVSVRISGPRDSCTGKCHQHRLEFYGEPSRCRVLFERVSPPPPPPASMCADRSSVVDAYMQCFRLETLTPAGTYGLYLGFIVIGLILAYYCYPETSQSPTSPSKTIYIPTYVLTHSLIRGTVCRRSVLAFQRRIWCHQVEAYARREDRGPETIQSRS